MCCTSIIFTLVFAASKMTPRAAAILHQSPDPTSSQLVPAHMTSLPQVVKVASTVSAGLSVVSAPAPIAQRRDVGSAGGQRAVMQQNVTYEKLGIRAGRMHMKATAGPNGVKIKPMELNSNQAIVFS